MNKNKHKNKNKNGNWPPSNGSQPSSAPPQPPTTTPLQTQVEQLERAAILSGVALEAAGEPAKSDIPGSGTPDQAVNLCSRLQLLIEAYTRANNTCEEREIRVLEAEDDLKNLRAKFDEEQKNVENARQALEAARMSFDNAKSALDAERRDSEARLATILEREDQLHKREADADAGFITRREETLRELQRAHEDLLERNRQFHAKTVELEEKHLECLQQQMAEHEKKLESRRRDFESGLQTREVALRSAEEAIRSRERELERALFNAREATRDAGDLKAHVDDYIEDRAAERVANLNRRLEAARNDAEALRSRIQELERTLAARDAAVRVLENMSPEAVKARIETLQRRIRDLEDELADRPSKADAEELRTLRDERTRLEQDQRRLVADKGRLESKLDRLMIEVDRVESLRDRNTALLETQRLLKAALDDLRTDIDERLDKYRHQPVFQKFLEIDQAPDLNEVPLRLFPGNEEIDLREFAVDLRHRVGLDPTGERPNLFYRDEDIRAFLGGLAMSRLHLIQGISGIGKSSLPRAFADAVGGCNGSQWIPPSFSN